jgi:hypothetical protein
LLVCTYFRYLRTLTQYRPPGENPGGHHKFIMDILEDTPLPEFFKNVMIEGWPLIGVFHGSFRGSPRGCTQEVLFSGVSSGVSSGFVLQKFLWVSLFAPLLVSSRPPSRVSSSSRVSSNGVLQSVLLGCDPRAFPQSTFYRLNLTLWK